MAAAPAGPVGLLEVTDDTAGRAVVPGQAVTVTVRLLALSPNPLTGPVTLTANGPLTALVGQGTASSDGTSLSWPAVTVSPGAPLLLTATAQVLTTAATGDQTTMTATMAGLSSEVTDTVAGPRPPITAAPATPAGPGGRWAAPVLRAGDMLASAAPGPQVPSQVALTITAQVVQGTLTAVAASDTAGLAWTCDLPAVDAGQIVTCRAHPDRLPAGAFTDPVLLRGIDVTGQVQWAHATLYLRVPPGSRTVRSETDPAQALAPARPTPHTADAGGRLPFTGAPITNLARTGSALLAAGVLLLLLPRRRERPRTDPQNGAVHGTAGTRPA